MTMTAAEKLKRYGLFIISLFFAAMGVAITKHGELGVSPISSVANVFSCTDIKLSLGALLIIWNCVLILGQIIILRRDFKAVQLLQIPLSFLFGFFTDFGMYCVSYITVDSYVGRIALVLCGTVVLGFGIALAVIANVIMNSGEAFVKAVSDKSGKNFGFLKIAFDIACVLVSVLLSLAFFDGRIIGTREGTIITALLTGLVVNFFVKLLSGKLNVLLTSGKSRKSDEKDADMTAAEV